MKNKKMKYPPAPKGNFILGNTKQFKKNPLEFMVDSVKSLGDIISFRILTKRVYMISDAETARYIMQTNNKNYTKNYLKGFYFSNLKLTEIFSSFETINLAT